MEGNILGISVLRDRKQSKLVLFSLDSKEYIQGSLGIHHILVLKIILMLLTDAQEQICSFFQSDYTQVRGNNVYLGFIH